MSAADERDCFTPEGEACCDILRSLEEAARHAGLGQIRLLAPTLANCLADAAEFLFDKKAQSWLLLLREAARIAYAPFEEDT